MLNRSNVLEPLPEENNIEPGKDVKFILWLFINRGQVTLTGFGHLGAV